MCSRDWEVKRFYVRAITGVLHYLSDHGDRDPGGVVVRCKLSGRYHELRILHLPQCRSFLLIQ